MPSEFGLDILAENPSQGSEVLPIGTRLISAEDRQRSQSRDDRQFRDLLAVRLGHSPDAFRIESRATGCLACFRAAASSRAPRGRTPAACNTSASALTMTAAAGGGTAFPICLRTRGYIDRVSYRPVPLQPCSKMKSSGKPCSLAFSRLLSRRGSTWW